MNSIKRLRWLGAIAAGLCSALLVAVAAAQAATAGPTTLPEYPPITAIPILASAALAASGAATGSASPPITAIPWLASNVLAARSSGPVAPVQSPNVAPVVVVRTIPAGIADWQTALIAIAAALLAAAGAVLADRARAARRKTALSAA
jgi:hypothetical protein